MKLISSFHQDSHTVLLKKVQHSLEVHRQLLKMREAKRKDTVRLINEYQAKPFYKRWVTMTVHITDMDDWAIYCVSSNIEFLQKLFNRAQSELTIELDDRESDILFRELTERDVSMGAVNI